MSVRIVVSEWRGSLVGYCELVPGQSHKRYSDRKRLADAQGHSEDGLTPAAVRAIVERLLDEIDPPAPLSGA